MNSIFQINNLFYNITNYYVIITILGSSTTRRVRNLHINFFRCQEGNTVECLFFENSEGATADAKWIFGPFQYFLFYKIENTVSKAFSYIKIYFKPF